MDPPTPGSLPTLAVQGELRERRRQDAPGRGRVSARGSQPLFPQLRSASTAVEISTRWNGLCGWCFLFFLNLCALLVP